MKNDKLEAPLVSSWESPDKNIDGKEWRDFPSIKGYLNKKSESLKKNSGRGENKDNLGRMKQTNPQASQRRSYGINWREVHQLEKNEHDNIDDQEGLELP